MLIFVRHSHEARGFGPSEWSVTPAIYANGGGLMHRVCDKSRPVWQWLEPGEYFEMLMVINHGQFCKASIVNVYGNRFLGFGRRAIGKPLEAQAVLRGRRKGHSTANADRP